MRPEERSVSRDGVVALVVHLCHFAVVECPKRSKETSLELLGVSKTVCIYMYMYILCLTEYEARASCRLWEV